MSLLLMGAGRPGTVASVPITAPILLGKAVADTPSATPLTLTTLVDVPAGATLYLSMAGAVITSVTDTVGNTYTMGSDVTNNSITLRPAYVTSAIAMPAGSTISVAYSTTATRKYVIACIMPNVVAYSAQGPGAASTTIPPLGFTTSTLASPNSIIMASTFLTLGSGDTWSPGTDFIDIDNVNVATRILRLSYSIRTSTAAVTFAPTNSASRTWNANYDELRGT